MWHELDIFEKSVRFVQFICFLGIIIIVFFNLNKQQTEINRINKKIELMSANLTAYGDSSMIVVNDKTEQQIDLEDSIYSMLDKISKTLDQINKYHSQKK